MPYSKEKLIDLLIDLLTGYSLDTYEDVRYVADELIAKGAVPVVHGHWEVKCGMNYYKERICSVCRKHIKSNFWNYCPNCGARIDGDGNG